MKKLRIVSFIAAFYELVRFGALFAFSIALLTPELDRISIILMMALAAPGFIVFAGYLYVGVLPENFGGASPVLAIGKLAGMLPIILLALHAVGFLPAEPSTNGLRLPGLLFGIILLFDLIFVLFLVSYKKRSHRVEKTENTEQLPEMDEVNLEE